jgi:multicomponent Na+:H+ antiporter subunit A
VHALGFDWDVGMSWLGVLTTKGSISVTIGAMAVLLSVVLGLLVYRLADAPALARVSVFSGGESLPAGDGPGAVDFAAIAETAFHPVYALDPDPLYLAIWRLLTRCAGQTQIVARATCENHPAAAVGVAAVAVLAGVWLV